MMINLESYEVDIIKIALSGGTLDNPTQAQANEIINRLAKMERMDNSELAIMAGHEAFDRYGRCDDISIAQGMEIYQTGVAIPAEICIEFEHFIPENYMHDEHGRVRPKTVIEAEEAAQ